VIAASRSIRRPAGSDAKLLIVDSCGGISHAPRRVIDVLRPGDLVIANDAATLPASLTGRHRPSGRMVEVRLAGRRSLARDDVREFAAVVFGEGDFRRRTEDRPAPPPIAPGDTLDLGPLTAMVLKTLGHPRLIWLVFDGMPDAIWAGLARHGRPIQYAHIPDPLALWDVWTAIAGPPVAFEPPSAGFALDWQTLSAMRRRTIDFVTLTHAAGISSTGDDALDARLPFDEPYDIPAKTAAAIDAAQGKGRRIVAVGTTVVRALEHAAESDGRVRPGEGVANQRIEATSRLRVVNAILSGVHEPGTSHYQLLRAFTDDATLGRMQTEMAARGYHSHEFGDSVFIERRSDAQATGSTGLSRRTSCSRPSRPAA
jgi:S-adenosylmethionine:tRNA ribosyltransferase-isomerase